jgi:hypothetical protein
MPSPQNAEVYHEGWLDLDRLAVVEVRSEDKDYSVESALAAEEVRGWRPPIPTTEASMSLSVGAPPLNAINVSYFPFRVENCSS